MHGARLTYHFVTDCCCVFTVIIIFYLFITNKANYIRTLKEIIRSVQKQEKHQFGKRTRIAKRLFHQKPKFGSRYIWLIYKYAISVKNRKAVLESTEKDLENICVTSVVKYVIQEHRFQLMNKFAGKKIQKSFEKSIENFTYLNGRVSHSED